MGRRPSNRPPRAIAVFGSSEPRQGEAAFEQARRLGLLLARSGYAVITGGYGGVMEAASQGAREGRGRAIGVPCRIFDDRAPNQHLDQVVMTNDLYDRSRELIQRARGYVVLGGRAGTLSELALIWALDRAGCLEDSPVILLGQEWKSLFEQLSRGGVLEESQVRRTHVAESPEDAVSRLDALLPSPDRRGA